MMTLKSSFQVLANKIERLGATFEELLQWAVTEGKPEQEDHVLVTRYDDATNDLIGLIQEARAAASQGQKAVTGQANLSDARQALITCQERINQVAQRFYTDMISFEALKTLDKLANEQRKQWPQWVSGVKDALDQCLQPIAEVNQSLFDCWQELSDRDGLISIFVQATGTGQQINTAAEEQSQV